MIMSSSLLRRVPDPPQRYFPPNAESKSYLVSQWCLQIGAEARQSLSGSLLRFASLKNLQERLPLSLAAILFRRDRRQEGHREEKLFPSPHRSRRFRHLFFLKC